MVRKGLLKKATFKQRTDENYEASEKQKWKAPAVEVGIACSKNSKEVGLVRAE